MKLLCQKLNKGQSVNHLKQFISKMDHSSITQPINFRKTNRGVTFNPVYHSPATIHKYLIKFRPFCSQPVAFDDQPK